MFMIPMPPTTALAKSAETIRSLTERVGTPEKAQDAKQSAASTVDQLKTELSKERIKCSVLEGAFDTPRARIPAASPENCWRCSASRPPPGRHNP